MSAYFPWELETGLYARKVRGYIGYVKKFNAFGGLWNEKYLAEADRVRLGVIWVYGVI